MRAILLHGPRDVRLVDTEKPVKNPHSAIVKVEACVLCGSDVHIWDGRHGPASYPHPFCAGIWRDNLFAVQFHPEKSQNAGLQLLKNFAEWN